MSASHADRWIALGLLLFAVLYALEAGRFRASFLVDPVGPRAFPLMLAGILAVAAIGLAVRPSPDRPAWPRVAVGARIALATTSLVLYAYLLEPLGYLLSTTAVTVALGLLFGGPVRRGVLGSAALVLTLYFLFTTLLGLYLPALPAL